MVESELGKSYVENHEVQSSSWTVHFLKDMTKDLSFETTDELLRKKERF